MSPHGSLEVAYVCRGCGENKVRIQKASKHGKPLGGKPLACKRCRAKAGVLAQKLKRWELYGKPEPSQWTPERKKLAIELRAIGLTAAQVGLKLRTTRNAIIGLWHREGLYKPRARDYDYNSQSTYSSSATIKPADRRMSNEELAAYRAAQPLDTRDMGAVLMGDPPPHRSALHAKS